jgi:hypothetical protein
MEFTATTACIERDSRRRERSGCTLSVHSTVRPTLLDRGRFSSLSDTDALVPSFPSPSWPSSPSTGRRHLLPCRVSRHLRKIFIFPYGASAGLSRSPSFVIPLPSSPSQSPLGSYTRSTIPSNRSLLFLYAPSPCLPGPLDFMFSPFCITSLEGHHEFHILSSNIRPCKDCVGWKS